MKCMYAQTRPRFILSSEGVLGGMEFEPMLTPREKSPLPKMSPEEDRTRDAVDSEPKHYQLSYSGPHLKSSVSVLSAMVWSGRPYVDNCEKTTTAATTTRKKDGEGSRIHLKGTPSGQTASLT